MVHPFPTCPLPQTTISPSQGALKYSSENNSISNSIECYICTKVGVPVFYSTSCDPAHQPEWESCAGSSLSPIQNRHGQKTGKDRFNRLRRVVDPRSKGVLEWNRAFLLARGVSLAVDPLFFYVLSIRRGGAPCLYVDGEMSAIVTVLRTCVDVVHVCHLWLQFRLAYVSRESLVVGCGKLVWDARAIAWHYVASLNGFWFDAFVILPIPQVVFWLIVPKLIREEQIELIMTILVLVFLFQFLPKVYHSIHLMRRMQKVAGYIFGTIWWGFGLNFLAYFIASHIAGGCWYGLSILRVALCLQQEGEQRSACNFSLSCPEEVSGQFQLPAATLGNPCGGNSTMMIRNTMCLNFSGDFPYGIYQSALPIISSDSLAAKILYSICWGLFYLSTFGNDLEPTTQWLEVVFSILIVLSGLLLFTLLIANIQVFLDIYTARKTEMQLRCHDLEWWMRRRQLPSHLRHRVLHFEQRRWGTMGGEDEMELIKDLPQGLRRDIKRHLCLDLIKKVPLFQSLDNLILDNICDCVKSLVFCKNETIIRQGDPVQQMVFIVHGRIKSSQKLNKGTVATNILNPGGFLGDELLSWCLRRPFIDRLPASSATFTCTESTEAFGLDANHLRRITDHFRHKFANDELKRTARYYSSKWRTWAAVNIQLAWRRYVMRTKGVKNYEMDIGDDECRLQQYAAMFMSIRPRDHLE